MGTEDNRNVWSVHGYSVMGASHERSGLPNQDAIAWKPQEGNGPQIMLAVADGHGSATYFRSHLGAQFAVKIALEEMEQSIREFRFPIQNLATVKELLRQLPASIVERWQKTVSKDWEEALPTPAEWKRLQADPKLLDAFQLAGKNPLLPYGATLLGAIITSSFIFYFQLGDGDIQVVTEDGQIIRAVKEDSRLLANETTSLCSTTPELAKRDFRITFNIPKEPRDRKTLPALILVSTDGYSNSFNTQDDFHKVGLDILHILSENGGVEKMKRELPRWLQAATQAGSGDDISLGLIWNLEYISRAKKALSTRSSVEIPASTSHEPQQGKQPGSPIVSPKERNHASATQEQSWEQQPVLIEEVLFPDRKAPGVRDLLIKSPARPPMERWEAEQYEPPSRTVTPALETDVVTSSQPNILANAHSEATQTHNGPLETNFAPTPSEQNEQSVPEPDSIANNRQTDHRLDQQRQELFSQQRTDSVPGQQQQNPLSPQMEQKVDRLVVRQNPAQGEYATIREALKHARDGTMISVHPGTYKEQLTVDRDVRIGCEKDPGSVTIITKAPCLQLSANHAYIQGICFRGTKGMTNKYAAIEISRGQSTLEKCDISSTSMTCVHIRNQETNPTLQRCSIHDSGTGIIFSNGAHGRMEQCTIEHSNKVGIEIQGGDPTIFECQILSAMGPGILVRNRGRGLTQACRIQQNQGPGILLRQGSRLDVQNCNLSEGKDSGIVIESQSSGTIQNCEIQEHNKVGILLKQGGQAQIKDCRIYNNLTGIRLTNQGNGIITGGQIVNHRHQAIEVYDQSTIELEGVEIDHIRQEVCAVIISRKSSGIFRNVEIKAHYVSIRTEDDVKLDLQDCSILSKTSYALWVLKECEVTILKCNLLTESSEQKAVHEKGSQVRYLPR